MPRALAVALRARVGQAHAAGMPVPEIGHPVAVRDDVDAHPDRTIAERGPRCMGGGEPRGNARLGDDLAGPRPARPTAQQKRLLATDWDEAQRAAWRTTWIGTAADDLILLDEPSTQTILTRRRARAPPGMRAHAAMPRNHGPNVTWLAALTRTGISCAFAFPGA